MIETISFDDLVAYIKNEREDIRVLYQTLQEANKVLSFIEKKTEIRWHAGERPTEYTPAFIPGYINISGSIGCSKYYDEIPWSDVVFYQCKDENCIFPSQEELLKFIGDI